MGTSSSFLYISILLIILYGIGLVHGQCVEDQSQVLLKFKQNLTFLVDPFKLALWNSSTDCCSWPGVTCKGGLVVGLDLSYEGISGGLDDSSSLFDLIHLQSLNLAGNYFSTLIPSAIGKLVSLVNLSLFQSGFFGQIPMEISRLTRLRTLDLTCYSDQPLRLEDPNLRLLVRNLSKLEDLSLMSIDLSAHGSEWSKDLSISLPNLRILNLADCQLSGPIDPSFVNLRSLSELRLWGNNFLAPVPSFFANFSNLTILDLGYSNVIGTFPQEIFRVPTLQILDLSVNDLLEGSLPEFLQGGSLERMVLSGTNFSGLLPNSIGNLSMLSRMELQNCRFSGPIPNSMVNLTQLVYLDLSFNMFHGQIPSALFALPSLTKIWLNNNHFEGSLAEFSNASSSMLDTLELKNNNLQGPIPMSLFDVRRLTILSVSSNNFSGIIQLHTLQKLTNLTHLDLSYNSLSIESTGGNFNLNSFPLLEMINFASCKQKTFPDLRNLSSLVHIDFSDNQIYGDIPSWIWNVGNNSLQYLNLSHNLLVNLQEPYVFPNSLDILDLHSNHLQGKIPLPSQVDSYVYYIDFSDNQIGGDIPSSIWEVGNGFLGYLNLSHNFLVNLQEPYVIPSSLNILDLHSNHLHGKIPLPPQTAFYVDYSDNYFSSSIHADIGNYLTSAFLFSVSSNNLTGSIPKSICNARLGVLDLSHNDLSGTIPSCLVENTNLVVLNVGENHLVGNISGTFPRECYLNILDLHGNRLEGKVPTSLSNCLMLEELNLGNNKISDTFPCWLRNFSGLRVLVLQSNRFQGGVHCLDSNQSWPNLQILDLASNNFSGVLPTKGFLSWRAMMVDEDEPKLDLNPLAYKNANLSYQVPVTLIIKGYLLKLEKILTIYTLLDLSSNMFQGDIPEEIGHLTALYALNMSHNAFTGQIPTSFGKLKSLESLDMSRNKLYGVIPSQLASLTFLSSLNLSFNQLEGMIPKGSQFQTFPEASFQGNKGLCGTPLSVRCKEDSSPSANENRYSDGKINWDLIAVEIGFPVGFGIFLVPLVFCTKWRKYYYEQVDRLLSRIFKIQNLERGSHGGRRRRASRAQRQRM